MSPVSKFSWHNIQRAPEKGRSGLIGIWSPIKLTVEAGSVSQLVQRLSVKQEALGLIPSATQKPDVTG